MNEEEREELQEKVTDEIREKLRGEYCETVEQERRRSCRGCPDRHPGCHSGCPVYAEVRRDADLRRAEMRKISETFTESSTSRNKNLGKQRPHYKHYT